MADIGSVLDSHVITQADVQNDPLWKKAPIIVCGNAQRNTITAKRASGIARELGVPAIRWRLPVAGKADAQLEPDELKSLYKDPRLWGWFIQGHSGYLSKNVNPPRLVSNGSPVTYESLTLAAPLGEENEDDEDATETDKVSVFFAKPGDIVTLSRPPYSVNIGLPGLDWKLYHDCTLVEGQVVLPIKMEHKLSYMVLVDGLGVLRPNFRCHAIDPATAVTGYKAQGKTIGRCLASFNKPPETPVLSYESAFVCMSRAKFSRCSKVMHLYSCGTWGSMLDLHTPRNLVAYPNGLIADGEGPSPAANAALDEAARVDKPKPGKKNQKKIFLPKQSQQQQAKRTPSRQVQSSELSEAGVQSPRPLLRGQQGHASAEELRRALPPPLRARTLPCPLKYPTKHLASLVARRGPTLSPFTRKNPHGTGRGAPAG